MFYQELFLLRMIHMETRLMTDGGDLHIQEFWVREKGKPTIGSIRYSGGSNVKVNPIAIDAQKSRAIVIAPANPISSIGPMLSLKEFRAELRSMRKKFVAISPIIGNRVISGRAEKYMKCMNVEVSPLGAAKHYRTILGKFIISESDDQIVKRYLSSIFASIISNIHYEKQNRGKFAC